MPEAQPVDPKDETLPLPEVDRHVTTAALPRSTPAPARVGRYEVLAELGRGGMGVVYRAKDPESGRDVALKLILDPMRVGEDEVRRFRREAGAAARLRHPGIVSVLESGEHEGRPFFAMELVEGESFEAWLRRDLQKDWRRVASVVRGVAEALAHAHAEGVIHRDVKADNVLLDGEGRPRLTDFGLARDVAASGALTVSGQILGTPAFMAPEQARGDVRSQGPCTDVYALGALLYRALTGRPPFAAPTLQGVISRILVEDPPPPRSLDGTIPPALETIALRCLEKEPARRYAGAGAVAEDLARWLDGGPILARPPAVHERAARWARRNPALAAVVGVGAVAAVALALIPLAQARARAEAAAEQRREARQEAEARAAALRDASSRGGRDVVVRDALDALAAWERLARLDESARPRAAEIGVIAAAMAERHGARELAADALARARALGAPADVVDAALARLDARRPPSPTAPSAPPADPPPAPGPTPPAADAAPSGAPGAAGPSRPSPAPPPPPVPAEDDGNPLALPPPEQGSPPAGEPGLAQDTREPPDTHEPPQDGPAEAVPPVLADVLASPPDPAPPREELEALVRDTLARVQALGRPADPAAVARLVEEVATPADWHLGGAGVGPTVAGRPVPRLGLLLPDLVPALADTSVAEVQIDLTHDDVGHHGVADVRLAGARTLLVRFAAVDVRRRWRLVAVRVPWLEEHARRAVEELRALLGTTPRPGRALPSQDALDGLGLVVLERTDRALRLPGYALELRPLAGDEYGLVAAPLVDPTQATWILGPLPGEFDRRLNPYKVRKR